MTNTTAEPETTETKPKSKGPILTSRQAAIYEFIVEKVELGIPPTVREIGTRFGIRSPNGVMCHLKALEKKGVIERHAHLSRAIRLTNDPYKILKETCQELVKLGQTEDLTDDFRVKLEEVNKMSK